MTQLTHWTRLPGTSNCRYVEFSPDGRMRAAGLWDLREGRDSRRFPLAGDSLMGADLRADGRFVATVTLNGPLKLWEVGTGLELASAESSDGHLNAVRFHPSQGLLAVAGAAVSLWRMA